MLCPNCKKEIENDSTFCEHCGARIKKSKKGLWITLSIIFMAIFVAIIATLIVNLYQINQYESRYGYVDLGLPSGTLWKKVNEGTETTNFGQTNYTYDEAVKKYGGKLPTQTQWKELKDNCKWYWEGNGYKFVGPNGNSIYLPAAGFLDCDGNVRDLNAYGGYWSSTPYGSDTAWNLYFRSFVVDVYPDYRCIGLSVRLVQ